uniref:Uncharacterized protein n=1 Tax=Arundo donax TaxID=35708 RepID=A0A0A9HD20_ARUDO
MGSTSLMPTTIPDRLSLTSSFSHRKLILVPIQTECLRLFRNFQYGIIYSKAVDLGL